MRKDQANAYLCPETRGRLTLEVTEASGEDVISGALVGAGGNRYPIRGGIPDLTFPFRLAESDAAARADYDRNAEVYDRYLPLTFRTFGEDETEVRNRMIDDLNLEPGFRVLEHGCGSGRDSELIARRLGPGGRLYLQDISPLILDKAVARMRGAGVPVEFAVANGSHLPFADGFFDATYHFGGLNTFSDIKRAFAEATRVTRPGGKVVMGDESMPPWLRETEFGRILMNSNPHYRFGLPLAHLPVEARKVRLRWVLGGVFYVIDYEVGVGEPEADFDFEIPGARGGTHRTRYYGQLEGVAPDTKELAHKAREKSGKSMHQWLNDVIRKAAREELGGE